MAHSQRNVWGALLLIGLGVLFLVGQLFNINIWSIFGVSWPLFVMIPGAIFLVLAATGDRKMAGFAVPGMIVTGTGAILWFQNYTDYWQSWAYVWTLYPVFIGLALMFMGRRTGNEKEFRSGSGLVTWGLVAFLIAASFFEFLIFRGESSLVQYVLPLVLIGAGGFMLLRHRVTPELAGEKRKFSDYSLNGNGSNGNGKRKPLNQSEILRQQIDEALAEDDEPEAPKPTA